MACVLWVGDGLGSQRGLLGDCEEKEFENGFKVVVKRDPKLPLVSFQMWVKAGSLYEEEREAGITHMIEHMIFKGTERHPKGEIAKKIEAIGGHINAFTSFDHTVYHLEVPKTGAKDALEILLDAILKPQFDQKELELERDVILEEYKRSLDRPETVLAWEFLSMCFSDHPYGRPIIGYEPSIKTISRESLLDYVARHYLPNNMFLVASGDISLRDIEPEVKKLIGDFPTPKEAQVKFRKIEKLGQKIKVIYKDVNQSYMYLGWPTVAITDEDTPILEVIEALLGHGMSSRLYENLRVKKRIVNSLSVSNISLREAGLFSIYLTLEHQDILTAFKGILEQIDGISRGEISEDEIEVAKRKIELQTLYDMEGVSGQAHAVGLFQSYYGNFRKLEEYMDSLRKVTKEEVVRVSKRYLSTSSLKMALLLPEGVSFREEEILSQMVQTGLQVQDQGPRMVVLKNGLRVIVEKREGLPLASVGVILPGGLSSESEENNGISQLISKLLLRGTKRRSAQEVLRVIESYGARVDSFSGRNSLGITLRCASKDLGQLIPLLKEILVTPKFPEEEILKVKKDSLNAIKAKGDKPFEIAMERLLKRLFNGHPYSMPELGTQSSLSKITRQGLVSFYNSLLSPQDMVISIVGDIDVEECLKLIQGELEGLESPKRAQRISRMPSLEKSIVEHIPKDLYQTHIMMGFLDVSLKDLENPAMTLLNLVLSRQGGRLFRILRDQQALAYVVSSFRISGPQTGGFLIYMACDPSKVASAQEGILKILHEIIQNGVTPDEIEEAKSYLLGSMLIEEQYSSSRAVRMALDEALGLGYNFREVLREKIEEVDTKDTAQAARKVFEKPYVIVTVGPN